MATEPQPVALEEPHNPPKISLSLGLKLVTLRAIQGQQQPAVLERHTRYKPGMRQNVLVSMRHKAQTLSIAQQLTEQR
ncbi:hypothetical protein [Adonisia turfae]|uniref:hypothetical protein n=1 Tax=Adonisia turfae TaxID=2950184 RepID=UPI0013D14904|nr:hypothetical protein [Adonisia turfae]